MILIFLQSSKTFKFCRNVALIVTIHFAAPNMLGRTLLQMPNSDDHLVLATHNLNVLSYITLDDTFRDWAITVTCYTALHFIEAFLFIENGSKSRLIHSPDHSQRGEVLKVSYPAIWKKYRPIINMSKIARYLQDADGATVPNFRNYYDRECVYNKMIKRNLGSIITRVKNRITKFDFTQIDESFKKCVDTVEKHF